MSLDYSIARIMGRLADWAGHPKYSLERRIDIFLTPFLETFVGVELGAPAVLLAPEFPLLSDLRESGHLADRETLSARTVNVDYLMRVGGSDPCWLFLELKTDPNSFDVEQAGLYSVARARKMPALVDDLAYVRGKTAMQHRQKYDKLIGVLPESAKCEQPIRVAYLAPHGTAAQGAAVDHFFPLERFAAQDAEAIPAEHRALWPYVRDLIVAVSPSVRP
jgi:hypothetical protein